MKTAVIKTNDDATASKLSAVNLGYINDPFINIFLKQGPRKEPLINRGTFVRTFAIDTLVQEFLTKHGKQSQIVSLGAGYDTRYLNLKAAGVEPKLYVEIDYPQITSVKAMQMCRSKLSKEYFKGFKLGVGGNDLYVEDYWLIGGDLNVFRADVLPKLVQMGLSKQIPTLFISECVLVYLQPQVGDEIISAAAEFDTAEFVTYEQIHPDDAFGSVMVQNLRMRGLELPSLFKYPDMPSQEERYLSAGFETATAVDLNTAWDRIPDDEKMRVSRLELLDELEELNLIQSHYCLVHALK